MSNAIYQAVTDSIIAQLEKGAAPWLKPWRADASAEYLLNFEKANKLLTGVSRPKVLQNGTDGAQVQFTGTNAAIGVIMPMRDAEEFSAYTPSWISESVTKALEAA